MFCLYTKGNCGFISLYYALKFEKEDILKKYNIECVKDLYHLFMNLVFDKYKHQPFLKSWPVSKSVSIEKLFRWKYLAYYTEKNIIEIGGCSPIYFWMMAKYLNIHINLIEIEAPVLSHFDSQISYMSKINTQIINPECVVTIHLSRQNSTSHAEYIGKNDDEKKELYEFEKGRELIRDDINFWKDIEINDDDDDDDDFIKAFYQDIQDLNNYFGEL
jgi:hypothetical protein